MTTPDPIKQLNEVLRMNGIVLTQESMFEFCIASIARLRPEELDMKIRVTGELDDEGFLTLSVLEDKTGNSLVSKCFDPTGWRAIGSC